MGRGDNYRRSDRGIPCMVHSRLDKHGEWSARIKSHPRLTPKQTSVFDAAFSASGDSATKQLSGLSWRGFVSWTVRENWWRIDWWPRVSLLCRDKESPGEPSP